MDIKDACEQAYKNGYNDGVKKLLHRTEQYFDEKEKYCCDDCSYPPVMLDDITDIAKQLIKK